jgi:hypothetical protein
MPLAPDAPVICSISLLALLDSGTGHAMSREEIQDDRQEKRGVHTTTTLPLRLKRSIKWLALGTGIGMMAVNLIA